MKQERVENIRFDAVLPECCETRLGAAWSSYMCTRCKEFQGNGRIRGLRNANAGSCAAGHPQHMQPRNLSIRRQGPE